MDAWLDRIAFAICERLTARATRHMCAQGYHDEFTVGTAMYRSGGVEMIACRRPGCPHVEQWAVVRG